MILGVISAGSTFAGFILGLAVAGGALFILRNFGKKRLTLEWAKKVKEEVEVTSDNISGSDEPTVEDTNEKLEG